METVRARTAVFSIKYPGGARDLSYEAVGRAIENLNARMRQRYGAAEGEQLRAQWHDLKQQRYELK